MAGGLVMGGREAERLMFVDTQSLKHDKMRSQLRKNIIMPLKSRGVEGKLPGKTKRAERSDPSEAGNTCHR